MDVDGVGLGFVFGAIFSAFIVTALVINNFSTNIERFKNAELICERLNTKLSHIYTDGDFKCENGSFIDKNTKIEN
jgi:hypothetical protein